jgi:hypothetical protein
MAYTIKYHGYEVACDTVDDLRALVNENGNQAKSDKDNPAHAGHGGQGKSTDIAGFVAKLQKEQRELLRCVAVSGPISRDRLRSQVGVNDTHKFAGILIGIRKFASGAGVKSPIEILYERENGRGPRTYQYRVRANIKEEIKEALSSIQ